MNETTAKQIKKDKVMYTENTTPRTFRDYEEIARLERSRAFHAGLAAIAGFFKARPAAKPAAGDCVA